MEVESPRHPNQAKPLLLGLGVSVLLLAAFGIVYALRTKPPAQTTEAPAPSGVSDVKEPSSSARASQVPANDSNAHRVPSGAETPSAAPPKPTAASLKPSTHSPAAAARSAERPADKPACTGALQIFSNGSWSVSGGPSAVQSPGRYVWPCGRYSLSAVSRMDKTQHKSGSVVIREGGTATLDLR